MSEHPSSPGDRRPPAIFDLADEETAKYRSLSSFAVLGLLGGLLSPLALFSPLLWLLPLAAAAVSAFALWQIADQAPNLVGRKTALTGLLLGVTFLVAAPADIAVYRYFVRHEAQEFAATWIDALCNHQIYRAHYLTTDPKRRMPTDGPLTDFYRQNESARRMLTAFTDDPVVRVLYALGKKADVRYYRTVDEGSTESGDWVQATYAVTYEDEQQRKKTFFVNLAMGCTVDSGTGRRDWTMGRIEGGVRPPGW